MGNLIAGSLVGTYQVARYHICQMTDGIFIRLVSETNDQMVQRHGHSLTYIKCMQLYDAIKTIDNVSGVGLGRDVLGGPTITILEGTNPAVTFSVCFCCHELGIIEDNRRS